jgi:hypothetical protein
LPETAKLTNNAKKPWNELDYRTERKMAGAGIVSRKPGQN